MENFPHEAPGQERATEDALRAKKFTEIGYPLSPEGQKLKEDIASGEFDPMNLPTVENPRPELFADFALEKEKIQFVFGGELADIQVTKGCRHQCAFCAAGAERTVQSMPFPAILRAAEKKREADEDMKRQAEEWFDHLSKELGHPIEHIRKFSRFDRTGLLGTDNDIYEKACNAFASHPFLRTYQAQHPGGQSFIDDFSKGHIFFAFEYIPLELNGMYNGPIFGQVTNYYDSDPFDYRDRLFMHDDGSPADFGDAAEILASEVRPLHITTAGWSRTDKIAERAAQKVSNMERKRLSHTRLSVNPFEVRARKDIGTYFEDTKHSIDVLSKLGLEVMIYNDPDNREYVKMKEALETYVKSVPGAHFINPRISYFSGPLAGKVFSENDHHDVMSCMPGYHIWPDGTIAKQKQSGLDMTRSPRGARPTPTGAKLW